MEDIQLLQEQDPQINGVDTAPAAENLTAAKRNRRPSVRLGEIGDQPAATATLSHDSHRRPKQWRFPGPAGGAKSSKTRPLAKLGSRDETLDFEEEDRDPNFDNLTIGSWKSSKPKRVPKRPRPNWLPKIEEGDGFDRDFEPGGLRSWSKEESPPGHSPENLGAGQSRRWRDEIEFAGESETDRNGTEDGVKNWLKGLGLGRYWPVFEIHEVDEEVLPLLTLDDLKEMGISAVGSRRKMFSAIEKLGKGFS